MRFCEVDDECRLDLGHLRSLLSDRTRVVAFPWASNGVGTVTPVAEIAQLAHDAGALAWIDAVHYGPHGPIDVEAAGADVLLCSPYKFYGPHLGLAYVRRELAESWRPYKVRPAPDEPVAGRFETGTLAHELLAGFVAAVEYLRGRGLGLHPGARTRAGPTFPRRAARQLPCSTGRRRMEARVPTFAVNHRRHRRHGPPRPGSASVASPCGTATTTPSRS